MANNPSSLPKQLVPENFGSSCAHQTQESGTANMMSDNLDDDDNVVAVVVIMSITYENRRINEVYLMFPV